MRIFNKILVSAFLMFVCISPMAFASTNVKGNNLVKNEISTNEIAEDINWKKEEVEEKDTGDLVFNIDLNEIDEKKDYSESLNSILPGSKGKIIINIKNSTKGYVINNLEFYEEKNKPENLFFQYNGNEYNSLNALNNDLKNDARIEKGKVRKIQINYVWKYETGKSRKQIANSDIIDTGDNGKVYIFKFRTRAEGTNYKKLPRTGSENNLKIYINLILIAGLISLDLITKESKENE